MHLLGHVLGIKIEVIRPALFGSDEFISHYPDEGADGFEKVFLAEEDGRRYNVVMVWVAVSRRHCVDLFIRMPSRRRFNCSVGGRIKMEEVLEGSCSISFSDQYNPHLARSVVLQSYCDTCVIGSQSAVCVCVCVGDVKMCRLFLPYLINS